MKVENRPYIYVYPHAVDVNAMVLDTEGLDLVKDQRYTLEVRQALVDYLTELILDTKTEISIESSSFERCKMNPRIVKDSVVLGGTNAYHNN